jgi:hypothetical protein
VNKTKLFLSTSLLAFVFFSCKNNGQNGDVSLIEKKAMLTQEEFISIAYDNPKELSPKEIQAVIMMFEINLNKEILLSKDKPLSSYEAKEKYYLTLDGNKQIVSKSDVYPYKTIPDGTVPVYKYDMIQSKDTGFVYVSADERFPCVLAYVPKGNSNKKNISSVYTGMDIMLELSEKSLLNNIAYFNHLKDSLRESTLEKISIELDISISDAVYDKIRDYLIVEGEPAAKATTIPQLSGVLGCIVPLITTKWDQQQPYNYQLNAGCNEPVMPPYVSHYPAGCLVTAAAQVIAHIEPNMQVSKVDGGTITINWTQLKQTPFLLFGWSSDITTNELERIDMASGLFKDIFNGSSTIQGCDGSITNITNMRNYLNTKISTGAYTTGMNITTVKSSLDAMKIVLAGGENNTSPTTTKDSHAWILDGYAICTKGTNTVNSSSAATKALVNNYDLFLHANMGCSGTGDGYYYVNSNLTITFDAGYDDESNKYSFWFIPNLTNK